MLQQQIEDANNEGEYKAPISTEIKDKTENQLESQIQRDRLTKMARTEAKSFRRSKAWNLGIVTLVLTGFAGVMVSAVIHSMRSIPWNPNDYVYYVFAPLLLRFRRSAKTEATYRELASELIQIEDVSAIGALAELLSIYDIHQLEVREQVQGALIRLLPRLKSTDAGLLNATQRDCLNAVLKIRGNHILNAQPVELRLAILKAYEQVGDEKALPIVAMLTIDGKMHMPSEVTAAARECLPILQSRVAALKKGGNSDRQVLLRGSYVGDVAPDTLLRPTQAATENSGELLRATNGETGLD